VVLPRNSGRGGVAAQPPLRLTVIGGGFTGVVLVMHVIRASNRPLDVTIIEPAAELGRGLAYSTQDPVHRINVPSQRMSVFGDEPMLATSWLFAKNILPDVSSEDAEGGFYVPRYTYGTFLGDLFAGEVAAAGERVKVRHEVAEAVGIRQSAEGLRVLLSSGGTVEADKVALCFGHATPALPCPVAPVALAHPKFVADPWAAGALGSFETGDTVLIAGTGLTMADTAMTLFERGHRGVITAISRRGLLPRGHGLFINDLDVLDGGEPPRTALDLLRLCRACVRRHAPDLGWQPAVDSIRKQLPVLWPALPPAEKKKVLKRLLPFWDVHRFRIAPQVDAALASGIRGGKLVILRSAISGILRRDGRFQVTLRRGNGLVEERAYDAIVLCTGPEKDPRRNPLAAALFDAGLAKLDDTGLGLAVDMQSRVLDPNGKAQPGLFAFGPLTRGTFGEMTGAPDIAAYIESVVAGLFRSAGADPAPDP
jgi:uncharacterized NAD(P)/FAD-binding protein YdhS